MVVCWAAMEFITVQLPMTAIVCVCVCVCVCVRERERERESVCVFGKNTFSPCFCQGALICIYTIRHTP